MAFTWQQAVALAEKIGLNEDEFRAAVIAQHVSSANVTNWKGGRPIPVTRYPLFSRLLGVSTDELHGRPARAGGRRRPDVEAIAERIAALDDVSRRAVIAVLASLEKAAPRPRKTATG